VVVVRAMVIENLEAGFEPIGFDAAPGVERRQHAAFLCFESPQRS
jgi:hypothetical protein